VFGKFVSTVGRTNVCVWEVRQYCWEDKRLCLGSSSVLLGGQTFVCKIPTLCQPSAKSSQILLVMSDSSDELPKHKRLSSQQYWRTSQTQTFVSTVGTRLVFCNRKLLRIDIFFTRTNKLICNFVNKQVFSLYRVLFRQVSLLKQY
jgi:hypothetical protein